MPTINGEEYKPINRARVVLSQVLACLSLDFLLIGLGMSISFVTMVLPDVLEAKEGLSITKKQASWFGSMGYLCQPLGSIFSGPLLDYFGRKKALFLVNIPHLIAWLLMYFAWDVPTLFMANALLGFGTGVMEAPSITYIGEVSEPSIRGMLTTLTNGFTSTGIFLAYLLGTLMPWRQAALVALTVPLVTMALVLLVPETPIWLLSKGRKDEALQSLCRLRGWSQPEHVQKELDDLIEYNQRIHECILCVKEGISTCTHEKRGFFKEILYKVKYVLLVKETMRPFTLVMAYFFFHSMSGMMPMRPNMVNVCNALGMKYDAKKIVVIVGASVIMINPISAITVKIIGKRKLIIGSLFATGVCGLALSSYAGFNLSPRVFSYEVNTFPQNKEILPLVLFMMLVCISNLGIPWVLVSEVFPYRSRGIATSLAAALTYVIFFVSTKTNYNVEAALHLSGALAFYAIFAFVGAVYLYLYLPETESKSLVEIEAFYKGKRKIFADDFFVNAFRKKRKNKDSDSLIIVGN